MNKEKESLRAEMEKTFTFEKIKLENELGKLRQQQKEYLNMGKSKGDKAQELLEPSKVEILESSIPRQPGWTVVESPTKSPTPTSQGRKRTGQALNPTPKVKDNLLNPLSSPKTSDSTNSFWGPAAIFGKSRNSKRKKY